MPPVWKTPLLEYRFPASQDLLQSPRGWSAADSLARNYSRRSQAGSHGCQSVCWHSWWVCQRRAPVGCLPPSVTGCWCCEWQWWALSRTCGHHKVAFFSSQWTGSTESTSSSSQPAPTEQETRVHVSEDIKEPTLPRPSYDELCLDFSDNNNKHWLRSLCVQGLHRHVPSTHLEETLPILLLAFKWDRSAVDTNNCVINRKKEFQVWRVCAAGSTGLFMWQVHQKPAWKRHKGSHTPGITSALLKVFVWENHKATGKSCCSF